uniref:Xylulose kinase-1 n=1 Tax=Tanacetum cinerariifolium TaxID=118510 RepID=A0A6L2KB19_TANCI|nr:xylulose kinase-1 [Tanacetum cinerariifolium]
MVTYLSKSDAGKGFNQIIDFLNGSYIEYALTVNPTIYVSCIKQFWNTVTIKQSNDVTRLQALVDKKKVMVTKAAIRDALRLDDAEGVDCLSNEEIFTEFARMGYEKPSTKLTFYKAFFSRSTRCLCPLARRVEHLEHDKVAQDLEITKLKIRVKKLERENKVKALKLRRLRKVGTSQRVNTSDDTIIKDVSNQGRIIDELDKDEGAVLMNEKEETKEEAVEVVTTAKLIIKVVAAVSETVSAAVVAPTVTTISAATVVPTVTAVPVKVDVPSIKQRRGVIIRDSKEESSAKTPIETKSKDKGKCIMVEEPKPMKKKQQVELDEAYARKLQEELNHGIDWEFAIDHVKQKAKEKVPVMDYQIVHFNNKPHYKIIRADGTHQLYVSFITLLKNFDREELDSLWSIVKERFSTLKLNNFSDDYLLITLRAMFGRSDGQDQIWKSQRNFSAARQKLMLLDTAAG